jgi:hypothetical protein
VSAAGVPSTPVLACWGGEREPAAEILSEAKELSIERESLHHLKHLNYSVNYDRY